MLVLYQRIGNFGLIYVHNFYGVHSLAYAFTCRCLHSWSSVRLKDNKRAGGCLLLEKLMF